MDKLRYVDAPLRGQDAGDEETPVLPMEAAQMAAMERKIKCTLPRLDATRAHEVASALETVMSWSTAADGWLRAPGAYTLVRKLVDLFYVRAPWPRTPYLPLLPHYLTNLRARFKRKGCTMGRPVRNLRGTELTSIVRIVLAAVWRAWPGSCRGWISKPRAHAACSTKSWERCSGRRWHVAELRRRSVMRHASFTQHTPASRASTGFRITAPRRVA